MDYTLNHKYKNYRKELYRITDIIHEENKSKFRFGHQWHIHFTDHFSERIVERDIPLQFVLNSVKYMMEFHRFEFRNVKKHFYVVNGFPYVIETDALPGFVTEIRFTTILKDTHKIGKDKIDISLNQIMKFCY